MKWNWRSVFPAIAVIVVYVFMVLFWLIRAGLNSAGFGLGNTRRFKAGVCLGHVARLLQNPHSSKGCFLGVRAAKLLVGLEPAPVGSEFFFECFLFCGSDEVVHFGVVVGVALNCRHNTPFA